jgi:hypothetical protein
MVDGGVSAVLAPSPLIGAALMALTAGTRLGPSIKVLPPVFAEDAGRRDQFDREAKAGAALSHPNIVAIFDTGHALASGQQAPAGGAILPTLYVVTEVLEGGTLRDALGNGALPAKKAIDVDLLPCLLVHHKRHHHGACGHRHVLEPVEFVGDRRV